jgi:predicted tellurium resistance membrane protein TerC
MNFGWALTPAGWVGLLVVTTLQVVLGVDNIVLISILAHTLKSEERERASRLGVIVAMVSRLLLLLGLGLISRLSHPFAQIGSVSISGRTIMFGVGGLFLLAKATVEMYRDIEKVGEEEHSQKASSSLGSVLTQIFILDIVFSLDQVISAVGLVPDPTIQVLSVLLSVVIMVLVVQRLVQFLEKHPSVRLLALSFLVLVGVSLMGECVGFEFPRPMLYFAMAYASVIEALNLRRRKKAKQDPILGSGHNDFNGL